MKHKKFSSKQKEFISRSEKQTFEIAKNLAKSFNGDEIVFLKGELGSGKTVFAKGIAAGLGYKDVNQVCSPSFTLVNIYQAKKPIFHIDLYRLNKRDEVEELGWEDFLGEGVIIVEWAEKMPSNIPAILIVLEIIDDKTRKITIDQNNLSK
ncbi:MAG: tRNA (adenosine(37)-N6)-threonylcarbamoyltransferase complex ATPase subunit type 1 TsaE [Acidobacteriota bacterium]